MDTIRKSFGDELQEIKQDILKMGSVVEEMLVGSVHALQLRDEKIPLALAGGLLLEAELLRDNLRAELTRRGDAFSPVVLVREPVIGAVRIAAELIK